MLKLNLKTEPYWIPLPGKIKVKVTPISTAIMSAAHFTARWRKTGYGAPAKGVTLLNYLRVSIQERLLSLMQLQSAILDSDLVVM